MERARFVVVPPPLFFLGFHDFRYSGSHFSLEQVKLFAQSEIVISSHGAGLTNMLFANQRAKMIEIIHEHIFSKYYWMLTSAKQ